MMTLYKRRYFPLSEQEVTYNIDLKKTSVSFFF